MFTTSLKLSQALQDVGVTGIETEKYHVEYFYTGKPKQSFWTLERFEVYETLLESPYREGLSMLPAYQFTDLPAVLRKIAKIKFPNWLAQKQDGWAYNNFLNLCELYAKTELETYLQTESTQGPGKAWESVEDYLFKIIK